MVLAVCAIWLISSKKTWIVADRVQIKNLSLVKILFHANQCGFRGTDVATYNYAFFGELLYNMKAYHTFPEHMVHSESQRIKLEARFPGRVLPLKVGYVWDEDPIGYSQALLHIIEQYDIQYLFKEEAGTEKELVLTSIPTLVHAVFDCQQSHGHRMLAISPAVEAHGTSCAGNVPYMVWMAQCGRDSLRLEFRIPDDAFVYGWLGGTDAWDAAVTDIVKDVAVRLGGKVFFMFQNFPADQAPILEELPNVRLIGPTNDDEFKCRFGQTMDIFLHPRLIGETFGMSVAEVRNCHSVCDFCYYCCLVAIESSNSSFVLCRLAYYKNQPSPRG